MLEAWPHDGRIAIIDLEYTAWDGSAARGWREDWEWREIVQIGCAEVDAGQNFAVLDTIEIMVRPQRNPVLSDYFTALTGISQQAVDRDGVSYAEAVTSLCAFGAADRMIFNGTDGEVLRENCRFHELEMPWREETMFNFRPLLTKTLGYDSDQLVSSDLPGLAGITVEGREHSALHDCMAIAGAFAAWRTAGRL